MFDLLVQFSLLVVGLILIWKTGEASVRHAVAFSHVFKVEKFSIGFTIFAISTCLPEISATVAASLQGVPELSAGNLMGSTLVNITLVLALATWMAKKLKIEGTLKKKVLRTMGLLLVILSAISLAGGIHAIVGIFLILTFFASLFWFQMGIPKEEAAKEMKELAKSDSQPKMRSTLKNKTLVLLKLVGSLGLLMVSSWLTVFSAAQIGKMLHIALSTFGATVISIGTSFTEFTLIIHAIKKREYSLALGDIFGASLVNLTLGLGLLILLNSGIDLVYAKKILPFTIGSLILVAFRLFRQQALTRKDALILIGLFFFFSGWVLRPDF
jgi:cation:H+ antiporter